MEGFYTGKSCIVISIPMKYRRLEKQIQDAVGIIKEFHRFDNGEIGIGVSIDGLTNKHSEKNLFWFNQNEIKVLEGENDIMIKDEKFANKNYKFAIVCKAGTKDVREVAAYKGDVKEGDYVIVNNDYCNGNLSVRIVVMANVSPETIAIVDGEIMGVADVTDYFDRKEREKRAIEIKKKMAERAKKYQEEAFWRMIAEQDAEMATLLKEFEEANK